MPGLFADNFISETHFVFELFCYQILFQTWWCAMVPNFCVCPCWKKHAIK